jgi:hypothetical protein
MSDLKIEFGVLTFTNVLHNLVGHHSSGYQLRSRCSARSHPTTWNRARNQRRMELSRVGIRKRPKERGLWDRLLRVTRISRRKPKIARGQDCLNSGVSPDKFSLFHFGRVLGRSSHSGSWANP